MSTTTVQPSIPVPVDVNSFLAVASAFGNSSLFPADSISFWLNVGAVVLNQQRWGSLYGLALILFVEHNLALEAFAMQQGAAGGIPGLSMGVIAATGGKSVSVSYDTATSSQEDAGHWNLTTYGTRLIRMIRFAGAGPIQLGTGYSLQGGFFNAWVGGSCGTGWYQAQDGSVSELTAGE